METSTLALIVGAIGAFASLGIYSVTREKHRIDLEKEEERKLAEYYPMISIGADIKGSDLVINVKNSSLKNKGLIDKLDMSGYFHRDYIRVPLELESKLDLAVKPDETITFPIACLNKRLAEMDPVVFDFKPKTELKDFWFRVRIFYKPAVNISHSDRAKALEVHLGIDLENRNLVINSTKQIN